MSENRKYISPGWSFINSHLTFCAKFSLFLHLHQFQAVHLQTDCAHHGQAGEGNLLHVPKLQLQGGLGQQAGGGHQVQPRQPGAHQDRGQRHQGRGGQSAASGGGKQKHDGVLII